MAGSISLYTQPEHAGIRTFSLGSFSFTDLEVGTDYVVMAEPRQFFAGTRIGDCWAAKFQLNVGAMDNLQVDKANQPFPIVNLIKDEDAGRLYPENAILDTAVIHSRPADWDVNWRDKYNLLHYNSIDDPTLRLYDSGGTMPTSSFGTISPPAFVADTYYATNQGRYIFWTMNDSYFALTNQWLGAYYQGAIKPVHRIAAWNAHSNDEKYAWTESIRLNGMEGNYFFTEGHTVDYCLEVNDYKDTYDAANARQFLNFVNFNCPIELPGGEIIHVEMIGACVWRQSADGLKLNGYITAIEKKFWEGQPEPPNDGPTSHVQGGRGTFSAPSDNRGDRNGSTAADIANSWNSVAAALSGGYHNYVMRSDYSAFNEMCQELWNPTIWETLTNKFYDPFEAIICNHLLPHNLGPSSLETMDVIKAADATLSTSKAGLFTDLITHFHVGSIDIQQYTDAFPDFTNTSIYLHLPYIATVQVDTAACMHGWLAVDYLCDVSTGDCTAIITVQDKFTNTQIRYEYKGNCAKKVPIFKRDNPATGVLAAVGKAGLTLAVAGLTGNFLAGMGVAGIAGDIAQGVANDWDVNPEDLGGQDFVDTISSNIESSRFSHVAGRSAAIGNGLGTIANSAATAALSGSATVNSNGGSGNATSPIDTVCWVLITRPQWSAPEYYARQRAYPSDIAGTVNEFGGFLQVSSVELNDIDATDSEINEIDSWLKSGVYTSNETEEN